MKNRRPRRNILLETIDSMYIIYFFPLLIVIGKVVRWTMMVDTLINYSKGWGYIDTILNGSVSFSFFEAEDVLAGSEGSDSNMYLIFKLVRTLFLNIPDDFYEFEIAITILWGIMLFLLCTYIKKRVNVVEFVFVCVGIIVLNVYCFTLAKEPFQMLYFYLLFLVIYSTKISDNRKFIVGSLVILFSVATFRTYYILILVFAVAAILLIKWMTKNKKQENIKPIGIVGIYLGLVGTYLAMMGVLKMTFGVLYIRMAECLLYASDATSSSNTYIENMVTNSTGNVVLVALEYGLVVLRLLFPIELLSLGVKYWPYIIYQFAMSILMIGTLRNYNKNTKIQNVSLLFFIGFVFASGTFEVDYGAWIRHGAVTLPLVLLMSGIINQNYLEKKVE